MKQLSIQKDHQVCTVCALVLGVLFYFILRHGAGVSTDSISFLNASENFLHAKGLVISAYGDIFPMTHFPPLYSLFLAGISWVFDCDIGNSARLLAAVTYALNVFFIGCFFISLKIPLRWNLLFLALFALSEYLLLMCARVFTEPIFMCCMLSSFLLLDKYLKEEKLPYLIFGSLMVGLSALARYVGILLIVSLAGYLFLFIKKEFWQRVKLALSFGVISSLPLLIWMVRNFFLTQNPTNRQIGFHPIGATQAYQFFRSVLFIFLSDPILESIKGAKEFIGSKVLFIVLFLLCILVLGFIFRYKKFCLEKLSAFTNTRDYLVELLVVFALSYPLFLIVSISFVDYTTPLSRRIMFPWMIVMGILAGKGLYSLSQKSRIWQKIVCSFLVVFLLSYCLRGGLLVGKLFNEGLEYSSKSWNKSEIINFIKKCPPETLIYSNSSAGIFCQTKRNSLPLPYKFAFGKFRLEYESDLKKVKKDLSESNGYLIYFNSIPSTRLDSPEKLAETLDLQCVLKATDGSVFGVKSSQ